MFIELIEKKSTSKFANNGTCSPAKRLRQKRYDLKKFYGLTIEEADELRTKTCEICGTKSKKMVIDHDHNQQGTYRGILCQQCNTRLGWFEKNQEIITSYLKA